MELFLFLLAAVVGGAIVRLIFVAANRRNDQETVVRELRLNAQQAAALALCSHFYEGTLRENIPNARIGLDGRMRMGRAICQMPASFAQQVADGVMPPIDAMDALTDVLSGGEHSAALVAEFVRLGTGVLARLRTSPRDPVLRGEIESLLKYAESNNAMRSAAVPLRRQFEDIVAAKT